MRGQLPLLFKSIPVNEPFGLNTLDKDQRGAGSSPAEFFLFLKSLLSYFKRSKCSLNYYRANFSQKKEKKLLSKSFCRNSPLSCDYWHGVSLPPLPDIHLFASSPASFIT